MKTFKQFTLEKDDDDPCWKGYNMVGTKKKGGKSVPNCVKEEKDLKTEKDDDDPCWKNYEMVGMKKKNGKDVPNCVPMSERSTSQLVGNLEALMADDMTFQEVRASMVQSIKGSPFFQGKSREMQTEVLKAMAKSRNAKEFVLVSKKYNLESLLIT
ncbi:hypothetical protein GD1_34 [Paraglaciecola Antarctic GD virus 1]|nr:hypothetical protein GD1_34 [Paraglaciecola Antarctic GD virus 1]